VKRRLVVLGVVAALVLAGGWFGYARDAIPSGVGLAAKHLCSLVYVSGLERGRARRLYVDPFVQPLPPFLGVRYDDTARSVEARGFGLWTARARHRAGLGCTVRHGPGELRPASVPRVPDKPLRRREPAAGVKARLGAALEEAFADPDGSRNTLAVAVLHEGDLVAERYAAGVGPDTPLPGWSMTKSVTATLVGILVGDGRLDVEAPGAIREWRDSDDPRAAITLDHLLRMTAGLEITEDQTGADPNSEMLFRVPDAAAYAASRPLQSEPGARWEYMSGNTVLAARAVAEAVGDGLADTSAFVRARLFAPLGMASAVLEPDEAGTFIGSSFMLASAHDWAKLGQLHLDGGRADGARLLPESWLPYITRPTESSGSAHYGAGWWLNRGSDGLRWPQLPADTFAAQGFQHQFVYVVPSRRVVVVRLGATSGRSGMEELVAGVLAALAQRDV
jgi:CubicO group peptidase (beta-lactamase class C family)